LVQYALLEDRLVAWVISKDALETSDLKIDGARLRNSIEKLAGLEKDRNAAATDRVGVAADLYNTLIGPLSKFLDPAKRLVIVPDKSLYYVPFASLVAPDGKFLVQHFAISYSPSSTIFVSASKQDTGLSASSNGKLLSIGDPAFDREEYPDLNELDAAETEAREIAAMVPNSQILTRQDATKEKFLRSLGDAQIVHFAGHYLPDPETPSRSKMVLAKAGDNSDLRMSEIAEKKFPNLKLVVLSACDTGIEDVLDGEGLISASRAFLAAGAPVVVASQWKVDSQATEKLMVAFHRNRREGALTSADALRQAQLEMIDADGGIYAAPYFWAAFSVMGGLEN
jgi:CHAT domain-containing protein